MMFKKLKERFVRWLFNNVTIDELTIIDLEVGNNTIIIGPDYIEFSGLTADPALAPGRIWFRSDLNKLRWSPDGSTVKDLTS